LRYALELFAPCFDTTKLNSLAKDVAALQTALGELHDADVWIAMLGKMLRTQTKKENQRSWHETLDGSDSTATRRAAAVWLLRHEIKARAKHFNGALALWHKWQTNGSAARLADALGDVTSSAS
jgi:hypothetical protein